MGKVCKCAGRLWGGGGENRYAPNVRVRSLSRMGIDGIESEWGTSFKVNNRYVCRA